MNMKESPVAMRGPELDYAASRQIALTMAIKTNPDTSLMAWYDKKSGLHSPSSVECDGPNVTGWEEYGRNHGGTMKIMLNGGEYVFIYS